MLLGRFRILGKLILLMLVPLTGVVALTVPIVLNRVEAARSAQRTADAVELARDVGSALQEIQEERLLSMGHLFGLVHRPELAVQRAKVDDRVARLTELDLAPRLRQAVENVRYLRQIRPLVLNRSIRPDLLVDAYTAVATRIIDALELTRHADLGTDAGRQVFALDTVLRADDLISQISSLVTAAVVTGEPGFVALFSQKLVRVEQQINAGFDPFATPTQADLYWLMQQSFMARAGRGFFERAALDPAGAVRSLDVNSLFPSLRSVVVLGRFLQNRIAADVDAAVTRSRSEATRTAYLVSGSAIALLLAVVGLSLLMARAVANPLRRLTTSADRIAYTAAAELERVADDETDAARPIHLTPLEVRGRDEIGDLARAFERVQTTAVQLVERQVAGRRNVAQMFGHVGRRTQNLVSRQLALIDRLERQETDPDRLRALYRLDHMSSRLHRNASSLVVLSGGTGADGHMEPLPLADVVRLALGEIEDYTRVDVEVPEHLTVGPAVVADLTLMLAELMENATVFSPPHTRVTVTAVDAPNGGVRLSIMDHGLGLTAERLAEENARLARRERLDLVPTEVLGLFVVGRLARRHGFRVSLTDTPGGGLTALLDLRANHLLTRPAMTIPGSVLPPVGTAPFDAAALDRASRSVAVADSWNAFDRVPHQPAVEAMEPSEVSDPAAARIAPEVPRQRRGDEPQPPVPLRRRVATGSPAMATARPTAAPAATPPTAADAAAARTSMDAFQAGISRAREVAPDGSDVAPVPAAAHPVGGPWSGRPVPVTAERTRPNLQIDWRLPVEPSVPGPAASTFDGQVSPAPGRVPPAGRPDSGWAPIDVSAGTGASTPDQHPLARRVPGASLPQPSAGPTRPAIAAEPRHDPAEARDLIQQFESGVALALREVGPRHEEQPR